MRICCVSVQTPAHVVVGGMSRQTLDLSAALMTLGHEVRVLTTRHPDGRAGDVEDGVPVEYLADTLPGMTRGGWWPASRRRFHELHRSVGFDVVWSQSIGASGIARDLRPDVRPALVCFMQGTGPQMIRSSFSVLLRDRRRPAFTAAFRRMARAALNYVAVDRPVYANATAVLAVSQGVADSILRWYRVDPARVRVVFNGIDTQRFAPDPVRGVATRARLGIAPDEVVLLTVGALSAQKGVDVAIDALADVRHRAPTVRLLVVGDGDQGPALREHARRRGVAGGVVFTGHVDHEHLPEIYNAADVFLLPTFREEGFANVVIEAMGCALPVIATRRGGNPEAVIDGETGFVVPAGDREALIGRIDVLANDRVRAHAMGERGRAVVVARWDRLAHARRIAAIFETLAP